MFEHLEIAVLAILLSIPGVAVFYLLAVLVSVLV